MADGTPRPDTIGVGSALRRAREIGGISLDEAARDTRLRADQLRALEEEDFEALGGDVYARAMLRTYAQYLGLKPGRVAAVYARHADDLEPPPPPAKMGRLERGLAASRIRDNQKFLLVAAAVLLVVLVAVGLVSRGGAPAPAAIPSTTPSFASPSGSLGVDVTIEATGPVEVGAVVDGTQQAPTTLRPAESVSFMGEEQVAVTASDGGAIRVVVDGHDLGVAGATGKPWSETFAAAGSS
ncbi:MAG TPA: helix-turn-helix domain-containing protein [Actinomycetota bacterium]|nr:helix-turn-helix domain-containing protein [Actinomycetota bacterium]